VRLTNVSTNGLQPIHGQLPVATRGLSAAEATKMPVPNLGGRQLTNAQPNGAGAQTNFSRQGALPGSNALQRAGAAPTTNGGAKTTSSATLDALRRGGTGSLTAPSRPGSASSGRAGDLSRSQAPPPPGTNRLGSAGSAFGNLRTSP